MGYSIIEGHVSFPSASYDYITIGDFNSLVEGGLTLVQSVDGHSKIYKNGDSESAPTIFYKIWNNGDFSTENPNPFNILDPLFTINIFQNIMSGDTFKGFIIDTDSKICGYYIKYADFVDTVYDSLKTRWQSPFKFGNPEESKDYTYFHTKWVTFYNNLMGACSPNGYIFTDMFLHSLLMDGDGKIFPCNLEKFVSQTMDNANLLTCNPDYVKAVKTMITDESFSPIS